MRKKVNTVHLSKHLQLTAFCGNRGGSVSDNFADVNCPNCQLKIKNSIKKFLAS